MLVYFWVTDSSYLHIIKGTVAVTLQAHVSEIQRHLLTHRQSDQVDTLAVVGVVIRPVWRDDDPLTLSEGTTTTRVT